MLPTISSARPKLLSRWSHGTVWTSRLGQRTYAPPQQQFLPGLPSRHFEAAEVTMREIDVAVRDILGDAFDGALAVLNARRADLDAGAKLLLAQETITADDFPALRAAKDHLRTVKIGFD